MAFPISQSRKAVTEFFELLKGRGAPSEYDKLWATSIGANKTYLDNYKSILLFIGFIDENSMKTRLWDKYRAYPEEAMKTGINSGYVDLLSDIPSAWDEENQKEAVSNWIMYHSPDVKNKKTIRYIVNTFYALCEFANFNSSENIQNDNNTNITNNKNEKSGINKKKKRYPEISINLQIVIPDNATPETYDNIFASINRFIFEVDKDEG